jgi:hypothetical protein
MYRTAVVLFRVTTGKLAGGSLTRKFERLMKEGSGNGASLSVGAL